MLRYLFIESREIEKIPLYIDFKDLEYDSTNLLYKVLSGINIKSLNIDLDLEFENGNCIILIDNMIEGSKYYYHIEEFKKKYPKNKIIITETEDNYKKLKNIERDFINKSDNDTFINLYLHSFGIRELRSMISKWFKQSSIDEYNVFNTMSKLILTNKLPRTPLIYSLFLGIIEADSSFVPINIASLFDKFSDVYLGKICIFPELYSNYDYQLKLIFLENLSKYMVDNNKKGITYDEYLCFVKKFSDDIRKTDAKLLLDDLIKSNFIIYEDEIRFSFSCFMFFFYAKYAVRNNSEPFLLDNIDISKYSKVIEFYSGLLANSENILLGCTMSVLDKTKINFEEVNKYIKTYYCNNDISQYIKELNFEVKSDSQINEEFDKQQEEYLYLEETADKMPDLDLLDIKINVLGAISLLCNVLKSSEYVKSSLRKETLKYCIDYWVWILSELLKATEDYIKEEDDGEELKKNLCDFIIFLTIITQGIVSQALGTTVIKDELMDLDVSKENIMYEFFICCIAVDLDINGSLSRIKKFIDKVDNYILLECIRYKLENIFTERNFYNKNDEQNTVINLIKDVLRKIHSDERINNSVQKRVNFAEIDKGITNHVNTLKKRKSIYMTKRLE